MRAMRARGFNGYGDLELVNLPKPEASSGKVLVRMTAAGVTPLDHTLAEASDALRYLIDDRPFGRVVLTMARAS